MIRINLLGLPRERKAAAPAVSLEGAKFISMALGFVGVGLAALAIHYGMLAREGSRLERDIATEEQLKKKLAAVKAEYELFEQAKALYMRQIDIIENLKKQQTGPVEMLNTLADVVLSSGTVWLTSFDNKGDRVDIKGAAVSVNAVADFMTNLKKSGHFKNVEIKESSRDETLSKEVPAFIFTLSAELATPAGATKPKT